jgi:hypothetical protein
MHPSATLTDVLIFGEIAVLASRRDADGRPVRLPTGSVKAPRGSADAVTIADIMRTEKGTLAVRGPMVPFQTFPRSASAHLTTGANGIADTLYPCRVDRMAGTVTVTGPPPGIVSVGGYRFVLSEIEKIVRHTHSGASVTALPDALAGHRLAGSSGDRDEIIRVALARLGVNPLLTDAFHRG